MRRDMVPILMLLSAVWSAPALAGGRCTVLRKSPSPLTEAWHAALRRRNMAAGH